MDQWKPESKEWQGSGISHSPLRGVIMDLMNRHLLNADVTQHLQKKEQAREQSSHILSLQLLDFNYNEKTAALPHSTNR